MDDLRIRNRFLLISVTTIIVIIFVLLAIFVPTENLKLGQGTISELKSDWLVKTADGQVLQTDLPAELTVEPDTQYQADYIFDKNYPQGSMLRVRASMQSLSVLLDGEMLFESKKPDSDRIVIPEASVWHFIDLPAQLEGKTLTLQLESSTRVFSGLINPVAIGSGDALIFDLLNQNWINITIVIFLLVFGVISIAATFIFRLLKDNRLFHLGLFAITVGLWLFSEAKLLQFITGNRFILAGLSYVLIVLIPVPFLLYLRDAVIPRYRRTLAITALVFCGLLLANLILQFSGIASFIESASITNGLILVAVIGTVILLFREVIVFKSKAARNFMLFSSVLVLAIVIEVLNFLNQNFDAISHYGRIGIVIFFIFLAGSSILTVNKLLDADKESKMLHKLAYMDVLTGASNRLAFERDIEQIIGDGSSDPFRLIMMDINNLKFINDRFGHNSGDQAIKLCYETMSEQVDNSGVCYRIGGDEFACILYCTDPARYQKIVSKVRQSLAKIEHEMPFKLELAIGSDIFVPGERPELKSFIHHVDQLMYANKRLLKEMK